MKSRREFLKQLALASALGGVVVACKSQPALLDCTDVSTMSDADKLLRTTLKYVDKSPDPAKICSGCNFFQQPAMTTVCGGCTLLKGPINPGGNCTSWVQKVA